MIEELNKYYANLLIVQYNGKPKASETIKLISKMMWANMSLMQIRDGFDWKTASAAQLDIIGIWVGVNKKVSRYLYEDHSWFTLLNVIEAEKELETPPVHIDNADVRGGYSEVSNFDSVEGGFLTPDLTLTQEVDLPVEMFRFLVGLKIIKNNIDHCCKSIDDAIYYFSQYITTTPSFNGYSIKTQWDLTNKQLIYKYSSELEEIMQVAKIKGVLPCPATCSIFLEEY